MSNDYDIAQIYKEMEQELISSMQRNLAGHIEEEKKFGFDFPQWQAEKLRSLRKYQIENARIINSYTDGLPSKVKEILKNELKQGSLQEIEKFKDALAAGYESSVVMNESFFKINTRKVNSLIKSIDNDLDKANQACLRYTDDAYRKVIFKSEMYAANGVFTEKKAVEKAIEDFAKQGIHCIEYADGSMRDIADYADMAIKTASQRAFLMGEGEMRKKIGNTLVRISKHGGTCPLCAKWEDKILIDDVYSGGTANDGTYTLLSEAMAAGLYHPRCRHGCGTYYPEIADIWNDDPQSEKLTENKLQSQDNNDTIKENKYSKNNPSEITSKQPKIKKQKQQSKTTPAYKKGIEAFDKDIQDKIRRDESIISGNNYETALVYDKNGNRILTRKGVRDEVKFKNKDLPLLKNSVITHNHPSGSCFSSQDIRMLKESGANEIRAVTRNKFYSIKAPEKWSENVKSYDIDKMQNKYEIELADKYRDIAAQQGESIIKYLPNIEEEAVRKIAEDMGFEFKIEVNK
ncbi:MAG: hypothetical protein NC213_10295 [Acetobacter sp.]|nr:hypothetical protein [Bacteroides sp.]MCM1342124.1 hypothetical protein [Acetobacter sp.]MCM1434343.1 hypothetical protein [Clostridiales bacterium]